MNLNKQFTEQDMIDFVRFTNDKKRDFTGYYSDLEDFKEHLKLKPETNFKVLWSENGKITAVRRLSDEVAFEVGQNTTLGKIAKFEIDKNWVGGICVTFQHGSKAHFTSLQPAIQPLFMTVDGVNIFKDDFFYTIISNWTILKYKAVSAEINSRLFFSTEKAGQEYVRFNRPLYSLNDIKKANDETTSFMGLQLILEHLENSKNHTIDDTNDNNIG